MSYAASAPSPDEPRGAEVTARLTRVLIATDALDASRAILEELRHLELDVQLCLFQGGKLSEIPLRAPDAVLCHFTLDNRSGVKVATVLKAHFEMRQPPIIGVLPDVSEPSPSVFDSQLFAPVHPSQIANRVNAMIRLGAMEGEIQRRLKTLRDAFDVTPTLTDIASDRRFRVLFIGKATPAFMIVINALQDHGVDVVAAFTSFSAFDYLHGDPFDAVVMNALEQSEPALTISETMRRNAKLFHVPTLFLVQAGFSDSEAAYAKGARDIIQIDAPSAEIRGRILELANYHRIHEQLKTDILNLAGDIGRDATGNVFSSEFLNAHLPRLLDHAKRADQPLCIMALQFEGGTDAVAPEFRDAAIAQTGALIQNLVRMQDVVARVSRDAFLLAFNDTDIRTGEHILQRIEHILGEVTYAANLARTSKFSLTLRGSVTQATDTDTAKALIERALVAVLN